MKIKLLLTLLLVLSETFVFSQHIGDYQSVQPGLRDDVIGYKFLTDSNTSDNMVNAIPAKPLIESLKPIDCNSSGSVTLSGLPTGKWVINPGGIVGSGTSTTIVDLAVGSYCFTVTNEFGIVSAANEIEDAIITDKSSTTWTNSWSNGVPTINTNAILASNYDTTINPSITACSLTIKTGVSLTITDGKFVAIQNNLTIDNRAALNIINEGFFVLIDDDGVVANNGTIKVNKTATLCENSDYGY